MKVKVDTKEDKRWKRNRAQKHDITWKRKGRGNREQGCQSYTCRKPRREKGREGSKAKQMSFLFHVDPSMKGYSHSVTIVLQAMSFFFFSMMFVLIKQTPHLRGQCFFFFYHRLFTSLSVSHPFSDVVGFAPSWSPFHKN